MDWLPNEDGMAYFCRDILPRIRQAEPESTLSIIGRAPTPAVRKLADIAGVEVTGRVDDVRPHIARGAVYVVPLRIGGGTRLKIFEAMAMGKAVVSTTVGAEGLPVTPGRDLVIADEPARFAHACRPPHSRPDGEARARDGRATAGCRALRLVGGRDGFRTRTGACRRRGTGASSGLTGQRDGRTRDRLATKRSGPKTRRGVNGRQTGSVRGDRRRIDTEPDGPAGRRRR